MPDDPVTAAQQVADELHQRGHRQHAEHLRASLLDRTEGALLTAIRGACQTILTAIEAIDPVSAGAVDELRLEVDKLIKAARN